MPSPCVCLLATAYCTIMAARPQKAVTISSAINVSNSVKASRRFTMTTALGKQRYDQSPHLLRLGHGTLAVLDAR